MAKPNQLVCFGLAVRTLRERKGMSQEELADCSGLHRTYIGGIERGERNVGLLNVFVISEALNTPASELLISTELILKTNII